MVVEPGLAEGHIYADRLMLLHLQGMSRDQREVLRVNSGGRDTGTYRRS